MERTARRPQARVSAENGQALAALALVVATAACSDSRTAVAPSPSAPPPAEGPIFAGTATSVVTGGPLAGATITLAGYPTVTSAADGSFVLRAAEPPSQMVALTATAPAAVERRTFAHIPGMGAALSLIPSSFDLSAFDQIFRGDGYLRRWRDAPAVVVERRVLQFLTTSAGAVTSTAATIGDDEAAEVIADLVEALPALTGGHFSQFRETSIELSAPDTLVFVRRTQTIVVARYEGLRAATGFEGYTRWFWDEDGALSWATILLDSAERSDRNRRRALRVHELGHALGWRHIDTQPSVMNPSANVMPTDFDRIGADVAFQRQPLNRPPDIDAWPTTVNRHSRTSGSDGAP